MSSGICPLAIQVPGADSGSNAQRRFTVAGMVVHRPQGTCPGVVQVGRTRHHDSPGTFQLTLCHDGTLHQHYPTNVRCSHAAGANKRTFGVEIEDYDETPLLRPQLVTLGRLARWAAAEHGFPLAFYDGPRIWVDESGFRGVLPHSSVDYPPNPAFRHVDDIKRHEWNEALRLTGDLPTPGPRRIPTMYLRWIVPDGNTYQGIGPPRPDGTHAPGKRFEKFPGAHVLVGGGGPLGVELVHDGARVDRLKRAGVPQEPDLNRTQYVFQYGHDLTQVDYRPR